MQIAFFQYVAWIRSPIASSYISDSTILLLSSVIFLATSFILGKYLRAFKNKWDFLGGLITSLT